MNPRLLILTVFTAGCTVGWYGNSWLISQQSDQAAPMYTNRGMAENVPPQQTLPLVSETANSLPLIKETTVDSVDITISNNNDLPQQDTQRSTPEFLNSAPNASVADIFNKLLSDRMYRDAIDLYRQQETQNTQISTKLRSDLIVHLELLKKSRRTSDFSTLTEHYLSIYYDDIDILLLLADFNQANGSYLEVVDVYLLAKTYAYSDIDQQKVGNKFNAFVETVNTAYNNQKNWWSLINFYSHVYSSGLMTSTHQYLQALAYLRSGDEAFAIDQFTQLLGDSVVGESAALALNNIDNNTTVPTIESSSVQEHTDSIALQKIGNQYAVNLKDNHQENIRLLIDTGASMTVISSISFNNLGVSAHAIEQERRVFRTAGGVVMGTVYVIPELHLGPYSLEDTEVAVLDFETAREIDGLLGMNILGQFRFQIDQENAQLHLGRK